MSSQYVHYCSFSLLYCATAQFAAFLSNIKTQNTVKNEKKKGKETVLISGRVKSKRQFEKNDDDDEKKKKIKIKLLA